MTTSGGLESATLPLVDLTAALSWRGWPVIIRDKLMRWIRRS